MTDQQLQRLLQIPGIVGIRYVSKLSEEARSTILTRSAPLRLGESSSHIIELLKQHEAVHGERVHYLKLEFGSCIMWVLNGRNGYLLMEAEPGFPEERLRLLAPSGSE